MIQYRWKRAIDISQWLMSVLGDSLSMCLGLDAFLDVIRTVGTKLAHH